MDDIPIVTTKFYKTTDYESIVTDKQMDDESTTGMNEDPANGVDTVYIGIYHAVFMIMLMTICIF